MIFANKSRIGLSSLLKISLLKISTQKCTKTFPYTLGQPLRLFDDTRHSGEYYGKHIFDHNIFLFVTTSRDSIERGNQNVDTVKKIIRQYLRPSAVKTKQKSLINGPVLWQTFTRPRYIFCRDC